MARVKDLWRLPGRRGRGKRYLSVWQDPDGHERTKAFAKKADAQRYGDDQEAAVRRGEYLDKDAGKVPIGPLAHKWLRLREISAASLTRYQSCYRIHVEPAFGQRYVGSVLPSEVAEWAKSLPGDSTRQLAVMILQGTFELAVADGLRRDNPVRSKVVPRAHPRPAQREPWPAARVLAVADACESSTRSPDAKKIVLVAAALGLRESEAFGLAAEDFDGDIVHIRRQVARYGSGFAFKLPKGGKPRDVPVPRGVAAIMSTTTPVAGIISLPWLTEDGKLGAAQSFGLLFRRRDGGHLHAQSFDRTAWKPALAAAGVPWVPRETTMHALRHWYDSTLLDAGVSLAAVMEYLGHSRESAPLAIGVYGHRTPESDERARQAVDKSLFGLRPVQDHGTVTELRRAKV